MLSRRELLISGLMAGTSGMFVTAVKLTPLRHSRHQRELHRSAGSDRLRGTRLRRPEAHPYWEGRTYTPEPATVSELKQVMRTLGSTVWLSCRHQPTEPDNSCVVDSIRELGSGARALL